jgi:2-oxo-3-hexenedioate decarboxylase
VAAYGLHGAYRIGERHPIRPAEHGIWLDALTRFEIELFCNGRLVDRRRGSNVLDGPLSALRYLVEALAKDMRNPPPQPGEIVTTGTLTRAFPVVAGETWRTESTGLPRELY